MELTEKLRQIEARHWQTILTNLGTPGADRKHVKCPFPSHDDKNPSFRYDKATNRAFCTCKPEGCTLTDAVMAVHELNNISDGIKTVENITGATVGGKQKRKTAGKAEKQPSIPQVSPEELKAREDAAAQAALDEMLKLQWIESEIAKMVPIAGTPAETYLAKERGLADLDLTEKGAGKALRFAPAFKSSEHAPPMPALVAIVTKPDGTTVAMQGTALNPDGTSMRDAEGNKLKRSVGRIGSGAIVLRNKAFAPGGAVALAEGLETGLTRLLAGPAEVRVCCGALRPEMLAGAVNRVELIADADKNSEVRAMARQVAKDNPALRVHAVIVSAQLGRKADLNDELRESGVHAVKARVDDAERAKASEGAKDVLSFDHGSDLVFAEHVIDLLHDLNGNVYGYEGALWTFNGAVWDEIDENRIGNFICNHIDRAEYPLDSGGTGAVKMSPGKRDGIHNLIMMRTGQSKFFDTHSEGIAVGNGFIEFAKGNDGKHAPSLQPHQRNQRKRHQIAGAWSKTVDRDRLASSDLMKLLNGLFDAGKTLNRVIDDHGLHAMTPEQAGQDVQDRIALVLQLCAVAALGIGTRLKYPAMQMFIGPANCGKSALCNLMRSLVPSSTAVLPTRFGEEYYVGNLIGSPLNVAEEVSSRALQADGFKRVITGELITARNPYASVTTFRPVAQHIALTNQLPTFSGGIDSGVDRRMRILPFDNPRTEVETDEGLIDRIIANEMDLFLHLVIKAACDVLDNGGVIEPQSCKLAKRMWKIDADHVQSWAEQRLQVVPDERISPATVLTTTEAYEDFRNWMISEGYSERLILAKNTFGKRLAACEPRLKKGPHSVSARFANARLVRT